MWDLCLQENAFWPLQCTCHILKMYAQHLSDMVESIMEVYMDDITTYGGTFKECLANLKLYCINALKRTGAQLGEMSFYGESGNCPGASCLQQGN